MRVNRALFGLIIAALFVSLMGNFLYGGVVVGHAVKPLPAQPEVVSLGPILKSLPEADRRLMRHNFAQHREDIAKAATAAKASATALRSALADETSDTDRLKAALSDYRRDFYTLRNLELDVFWDGAEQLSPEGRKKLADSPAFDRAIK